MLNTEVQVVSHFPPHYLLMVPVLITFISPGGLSRSRLFPPSFYFPLFVEGDGNNDLTR